MNGVGGVGSSSWLGRCGDGMCHARAATRHQLRATGVVALLLLLSLHASPAQAQSDSARLSWLDRLAPRIVAGAFVRQVALDIEDRPAASARGLLLHVGLRVRPLAPFCRAAGGRCETMRRIALTPQAGLGGTHLRGIDAAPDDGSFATFELLGAKLGYDLGARLSAFVMASRGTRSSEQFEDGDVVNLWGTGTSAGLGAEWTITPLGRGVEVALVRHWGSFANREGRDALGSAKVVTAVDRPFEAWSIQVGWSGPFGGVTWPWQ